MAHEKSKVTAKTKHIDLSLAAKPTEHLMYARVGYWRRGMHAAVLLIVPLTALALPPLEFVLQLTATFCGTVFIYLHLRRPPLAWYQLRLTTVSSCSTTTQAKQDGALMPRLCAWHYLNSQQAFYVTIYLQPAMTPRPQCVACFPVEGISFSGRLLAHSLVSDVGIYLCWQQVRTEHHRSTQSHSNIPIPGKATDAATVLYGYWLYRDELSDADFRTLSRICQSQTAQYWQVSGLSLSER
jgi:hypothetical protein